MPTRLIVFDLDGTLLDTLTDLTAACVHALTVHGYPPRTRDEVRRFVGNGTFRLMARAVPEGVDGAALDRVFATFTAYYAEHLADTTAPYRGIPEALDRLSGLGYRLAMLSNKPDPAVGVLAERYFPGRFDAAVGESRAVPRKPDPTGLRTLMHRLGATPETTVYIGDSEPDAETARAAGVPCIGVLWGFRDRATLEAAGADVCIGTPDALDRAIRTFLP